MGIESAYTGEKIANSDGAQYEALDVSRIVVPDEQFLFAKKTKPILVKIAKPGEAVVTSPGKIEESRYVAKGGEVIFVNELPDGSVDAYVPRSADGQPSGAKILAESYELIGGDLNGDGAYYRPKAAPCKILHEIIDRSTVLKDAWGPGAHQFLKEKATLKFEGGRVTGIDKAAFDATWSITDETGRIQSVLKTAPLSR